jgi:hypothetical protein
MVRLDDPREHVFWGFLYARLPKPLRLDHGPEQGQVPSHVRPKCYIHQDSHRTQGSGEECNHAYACAISCCNRAVGVIHRGDRSE